MTGHNYVEQFRELLENPLFNFAFGVLVTICLLLIAEYILKGGEE